MKPTPGPWTWDGEYPIRIIGSDRKIVCGDMMPSQTADINLIAAAPLLLEACKTILHALNTGEDEDFEFAENKLETAIAKAEGRDNG
jgi:hypothetical protein